MSHHTYLNVGMIPFYELMRIVQSCVEMATNVKPDQTAPNIGAQWVSGRVLDSRPRGCRFEPHRCHCVVSLSKTN